MQINKLKLALLYEAFTPNHKSIMDLVKNKRVATIYYKGDKENAPGWRTIEPVCYGAKNGNQYLRAWQRKGKTTTIQPAWKFFRVDRMRNWNIASSETFQQPHDNFNPHGDKLMDQIYAISDFNPDYREPNKGGGTPSKPVGPKKPQKPGLVRATEPDKAAEKEPSKKPLKGPSRPGASKEPEPTTNKEPEKKEKPKSQHYASSRDKSKNLVNRLRSLREIFELSDEQFSKLLFEEFL